MQAKKQPCVLVLPFVFLGGGGWGAAGVGLTGGARTGGLTGGAGAGGGGVILTPTEGGSGALTGTAGEGCTMA